MYVLTWLPSVLELAVFVGGLVAGILLRRRDGKASLLVALGFGGQILAILVTVSQSFAISALIEADSGPGSAGSLQTVSFVFGLLLALLRLAGCALVFFGVLRLVRRRPTTVTGVAR